MKTEILKLKVCAHCKDCGDGSQSVSFYKDEETAKRNIAGDRGCDVEEVDFDDDPYEWGQYRKSNIKI